MTLELKEHLAEMEQLELVLVWEAEPEYLVWLACLVFLQETLMACRNGHPSQSLPSSHATACKGRI